MLTAPLAFLLWVWFSHAVRDADIYLHPLKMIKMDLVSYL